MVTARIGGRTAPGRRGACPIAAAGTPGLVEAVIVCGIQGSGKSTFVRERFFDSHVRLSRDLLRTAHREKRFLEVCLETRQPFVVDKVNATRADRAPYVQPALDAGYRAVAYLLDVRPDEAIARNAARSGCRRIPVAGILGAYKRLEVPRSDEGFAEVWRVEVTPGGFVVRGGETADRHDRGLVSP